MGKRQATEQRSLEEVLTRLPDYERFARKLAARLDRVRPLPRTAQIVEIGAAQGGFLLALTVLGFNAVGVAPWGEARETASQLAQHQGRLLDMRPGLAEALPLEDGSGDAVIAANVIEHVSDAHAAFREALRVLKPGGIFWFSAASSICPHQKEIDRFFLFPWYPNGLKLKIMNWAKRRRPRLVGNTQAPAVNWFTPQKARRMLRQAGFGDVYDRWDLRLDSEGGSLYRLAIKSVRSCFLTKLFADFSLRGMRLRRG